jgi:hypothetical protein
MDQAMLRLFRPLEEYVGASILTVGVLCRFCFNKNIKPIKLLSKYALGSLPLSPTTEPEGSIPL